MRGFKNLNLTAPIMSYLSAGNEKPYSAIEEVAQSDQAVRSIPGRPPYGFPTPQQQRNKEDAATRCTASAVRVWLPPNPKVLSRRTPVGSK